MAWASGDMDKDCGWESLTLAEIRNNERRMILDLKNTNDALVENQNKYPFLSMQVLIDNVRKNFTFQFDLEGLYLNGTLLNHCQSVELRDFLVENLG